MIPSSFQIGRTRYRVQSIEKTKLEYREDTVKQSLMLGSIERAVFFITGVVMPYTLIPVILGVSTEALIGLYAIFILSTLSTYLGLRMTCQRRSERVLGHIECRNLKIMKDVGTDGEEWKTVTSVTPNVLLKSEKQFEIAYEVPIFPFRIVEQVVRWDIDVERLKEITMKAEEKLREIES